jgi:membrane-bound lytic murein transglycosylase B
LVVVRGVAWTVGPVSRNRLFVSCAVALSVLVCTAAPVTAESQDVTEPSVPVAPPTSTVAPPSTSVPPTSTTVAPAPVPEVPASVTPPAPQPQQLLAVLPPVPVADPTPLALDVSVDASGVFGAAERDALAATAELAEVTAALVAAEAELVERTADMQRRATEANTSERDARAAEAEAADASRVARVAAAEALISEDRFGHPTTRLAVRGELAGDELWARGVQHAVVGPLAQRATSAERAAQRARDDADSAAEALEESRSQRSTLVARLEALRIRSQEATVAAQQSSAAADAARAALVSAAAVPSGERSAVLDIPTRTLDAYLLAASRARAEMPACSMQWWVIAGIGAIETGHGTFRGAYPDAAGVVRPAILGPRLDGGSFARIGDTDGGRLDGDTEFDRAVGPMQFIPSTWKFSGRDGNGDGVVDPHNVYDAAYAAALYLCRGARGAAVDTPEGFSAAAWSYNRSRPYGASTWARAVRYSAVSPRVLGGLSDAG